MTERERQERTENIVLGSALIVTVLICLGTCSRMVAVLWAFAYYLVH